MLAFGVGSKNPSHARGVPGSAKLDAKDKNQPFHVEIELAANECDTANDRLLIRAKSFPGYPAHAVLMGLGQRANEHVYKKIVEEGDKATWEVKPTSVYTALLELSAGQELLAVEDGVEKKLTELREDVSMGVKRLARAKVGLYKLSHSLRKRLVSTLETET
jgi:hypothetical protein